MGDSVDADALNFRLLVRIGRVRLVGDYEIVAIRVPLPFFPIRCIRTGRWIGRTVPCSPACYQRLTWRAFEDDDGNIGAVYHASYDYYCEDAVISDILSGGEISRVVTENDLKLAKCYQ